MATQGLWRVIAAGKLGLGQSRVDFFVTNVMKQNRRPAFSSFEFRDQVMMALRDALGNRSQAQGANGNGRGL